MGSVEGTDKQFLPHQHQPRHCRKTRGGFSLSLYSQQIDDGDVFSTDSSCCAPALIAFSLCRIALFFFGSAGLRTSRIPERAGDGFSFFSARATWGTICSTWIAATTYGV